MLSRWNVPGIGYSYARRKYNLYNAELSKHLWAGVAAIDTTKHLLGQINPPAESYSLVIENRAHRHRLDDITAERWNNDVKGFRTWTTHSFVMALSANFEIYLKRIVYLSLQSDPGARFSMPKAIDGAIPLLNQPSYDYDNDVESVVKGNWTQRVSAYRQLFDGVPPILNATIAELDKFRNTRNACGHVFARDESHKNFELYHGLKPLSVDRVIKWMDMVGEIVRAVDNHLFNEHIGMYELISIYNSMQCTADEFEKKLRNAGYIVGISVCREIDEFVHSHTATQLQ